MNEYLKSTEIIDWNHPEILLKAKDLSANKTSVPDVVKSCFEWVRDNIKHIGDYNIQTVSCSASEVIISGSEFFEQTWTHEGGGLYSAPWTSNKGPDCSTGGGTGANSLPDDPHYFMRDMVFYNGVPLRQKILEDWSYSTATKKLTYNGFTSLTVRH